MIPALMLATGVVAGLDLRRVVLLAAVVHVPIVVAVLLTLVSWRSRQTHDVGPALFCEAVSSELRAGATLRQALLAAAGPLVGLQLSSESSIDGIAAALASTFPDIGLELQLTAVASARTGADAAVLFDEIGSLALAQAETRRELRVATAPVRATALVLVAAPLLFVLSRLGSGRVTELFALPQQRAAAITGLGLFLAGLIIAATILWRASR